MNNKIVFLGNFLLDLIFPPICLYCEKYSKAPVCAHCFSKIKFYNILFREPGLPILGSACPYDNEVINKLIACLKFEKIKEASLPLAEILFKYLENLNLTTCLQKSFVLIPVPLSRKRLRERGFNQSELLGKILASKLNLKFSSRIIERIKETRPQTEFKEKEEREENVKNCFRINSAPPKNVLLLDDVFTTGSTMLEAVKTLKQAGTRRIICLTAAKA